MFLPKPPRAGIATARQSRLTELMIRLLGLASCTILLAACAAPRQGVEDTWGNRFSDAVDTVVPEALKFGQRAPALNPAMRAEPQEFLLAERREVRIFFTVQNTTPKAERLEFATAQRLELSVRAPDGKRIFLWSEDRTFESNAAIVVVNPRERIEYEAVVPTRDMTAGGIYTVEAGLVGYPEVAASLQLKPL